MAMATTVLMPGTTAAISRSIAAVMVADIPSIGAPRFTQCQFMAADMAADTVEDTVEDMVEDMAIIIIIADNIS